MLLLEHDAKTLLRCAGIPCPAGCLVGDATATPPLPPGPWVVKAQVPVGGRGKAGGIRPARNAAEIGSALRAILGKKIGGQVVRACRIEQLVSGHEAYLSLSVDPAAGGVRLLFAPDGGVEIERLHARGQVVRSTLVAPVPAEIAAAFSGLSGDLAAPVREKVASAGARLGEAFCRFEATLLEVNPLFVTETGWVAGDAKMILDGNAIPRRPELETLLRDRRAAYPDAFLKLDSGFDYVEIDPEGEIGMVTTGAGLSMALIDELAARGLRAFNFCDIRTGQMRGDPRRLIEELTWISRGRNIRVVLVSVFAGITHLGEFAGLLVQAMRAVPALRVPVIARIIGNGLDEARAILGAIDLDVTIEPDLDRALALAERLART